MSVEMLVFLSVVVVAATIAVSVWAQGRRPAQPTPDARAGAMRAAYNMPAPPAAVGGSRVRGGSYTGADGRTTAWQYYEPDTAATTTPPAPPGGITINNYAGGGAPASTTLVDVPPFSSPSQQATGMNGSGAPASL